MLSFDIKVWSCDLGAVLPIDFFSKTLPQCQSKTKLDSVFKPTKVDEALCVVYTIVF